MNVIIVLLDCYFSVVMLYVGMYRFGIDFMFFFVGRIYYVDHSEISFLVNFDEQRTLQVNRFFYTNDVLLKCSSMFDSIDFNSNSYDKLSHPFALRCPRNYRSIA